ncbi:hypothetical protein TWF694_004597 [Orbilia ellipsospora]|uniref:Uncharacterized protein n=1 Tax=Orbilia ellipsospora TaxID=2528407 RepID=A0AAV9WY68_9PEZI
MDVNRLISKRIEELCARLKDYRTEVETFGKELQNASEGTFLWVGCTLSEICMKETCITWWKVSNATKTLPSELASKYKRMFSRLDPSEEQVIMFILTWIIFSYKGLKITELIAATPALVKALNDARWSKTARFKIRQELLDAEYIRHCIDRCLAISLVYIHEGIVYPIHKSLERYFCSLSKGSHDVFPEGYFEAPYCHYNLARACFGFLQSFSHLNRKLSGRELREFQEQPLASYAMNFWSLHARDGKELIGHPAVGWNPFLDENRFLLLNWFAFKEEVWLQQHLVVLFPIGMAISKFTQKKSKRAPNNTPSPSSATRPGMPAPENLIDFAVYSGIKEYVEIHMSQLHKRLGETKILENALQIAEAMEDSKITKLIEDRLCAGALSRLKTYWVEGKARVYKPRVTLLDANELL